jgi:hypothetical protein
MGCTDTEVLQSIIQSKWDRVKDQLQELLGIRLTPICLQAIGRDKGLPMAFVYDIYTGRPLSEGLASDLGGALGTGWFRLEANPSGMGGVSI